MRRTVVLALIAAGCAGAPRSSASPSHSAAAPTADDPDISVPTREKAKPDSGFDDPNVTHLDMTADDEGDNGPSEMVTAPPKRTPLGSMMPSVVTGPGGMAPMNVADE